MSVAIHRKLDFLLCGPPQEVRSAVSDLEAREGADHALTLGRMADTWPGATEPIDEHHMRLIVSLFVPLAEER